MRRQLDDHGLVAEFVAPRLWEHPDDDRRRLHVQRREGAHIRHRTFQASRRHRTGTGLRSDGVVAGARGHRTCASPRTSAGRRTSCWKRSIHCWPTTKGCASPSSRNPTSRWISLISRPWATPWPWAPAAADPKRVGVLMESAHSILAGLDPADEIGFAMAFGKLWSVHLNDQNGLKFDQDRSFGVGGSAAGRSTRCACSMRTAFGKSEWLGWTSRRSAPSRPEVRDQAPQKLSTDVSATGRIEPLAGSAPDRRACSGPGL